MKKCFILATLFLTTFAHAHTASWYGNEFHGRKTANGEIYNQWNLTTASNSHKMGTKLRVTNVKNGKSVVVRVNDTGAFTRKYGRTLDLSRGAFSKIASTSEGIVKVKIEVLK